MTAFVYAVVASPSDMLGVLGGFRAALFYVGNWHFIHQGTNDFAADVNSSPVLHFWSLAVEEQFYLLWPLTLGVLYVVTARAGRRRWWVLRAIVLPQQSRPLSPRSTSARRTCRVRTTALTPAPISSSRVLVSR